HLPIAFSVAASALCGIARPVTVERTGEGLLIGFDLSALAGRYVGLDDTECHYHGEHHKKEQHVTYSPMKAVVCTGTKPFFCQRPRFRLARCTDVLPSISQPTASTRHSASLEEQIS